MNRIAPTFCLVLAACSVPDRGTRSAAEVAPRSLESLPTESAAWWFEKGRAAVAERAARVPGMPSRAKNAILFIGDGMGVSSITAIRILAGQLAGKSGEEHDLAVDEMPFSGLVKTYNTNQQVPDSAGTMTAMMSGVKTKSGVVGVGPDVVLGDASTTQVNRLRTFVEELEERGFATGVVSTARITHATPAATFSHVASRNFEASIAQQCVEFDFGDGPEVVLGGGRRFFDQRKDERNLIEEWQQRHRGGRFVEDRAGLMAAADEGFRGPLLGLFASSHMSYECDRDPQQEPSLEEMTEVAIDHLQDRDQGFFLVVEAGRIDHGHHANSAYRALHDGVAMDRAIRAALEKTSRDDTLVLVTADHSHCFDICGYPTRGNPILGLVRVNGPDGAPTDTLMRDAAGKPVTTLMYANGPGHVGASLKQPAGPKRYPHESVSVVNGRQVRFYTDEPHVRPDLTDVDTTAKDYLQEAAFPMGSETHSGEDVPIYGVGPGAHLISGTLEQNVIFHVLAHCLGVADEELRDNILGAATRDGVR